MQYEHVELTDDQAYALSEKPGWDWIAETRQSDLYWNKNTGELLRIPHDDEKPAYQKLVDPSNP